MFKEPDLHTLSLTMANFHPKMTRAYPLQLGCHFEPMSISHTVFNLYAPFTNSNSWSTLPINVVCNIYPSFDIAGTDFCENTKPKSDSYAKKMGLPPYDYVLHPRVTGFTFLVEELRKSEYLCELY